MNKVYHVLAGKYEGDGEENCKFAGGPHEVFSDAVDEWRKYNDYPWSRIEMIHNGEVIDFDAHELSGLISMPDPEKGEVDYGDKYMNLWPQIGQLYMHITGQRSMPVLSDDEVMKRITDEFDCLHLAYVRMREKE